MSDIEDCASQKIDASPSSNSARNSKSHSFVQAILAANSQTLCSYGRGIFVPGERISLPQLEKTLFTRNWIIAHSDIANSPQKSCPPSPILGICSAKRSPKSPILGYQWKRIKREVNGKVNCRVSLNEKFREAEPDAQPNVRIEFKKEEPELFGVGVDCPDNESEKTLTSADSPVFNNGVSHSPTLNNRVFCRLSWQEQIKRPEDTTSKRNNRRSLIREESKIPESLSLSSPLGARSESAKIENASDDSIPKIESHAKRLCRLSETLVPETPNEVEIISSFSKIPETLSLSTIAEESKDIENRSKCKDYNEENGDIEDLEKIRRRLQWCSPIKIETESLTKVARHSKELGIASPANKNTTANNKSTKIQWIRAKEIFVKPETLASFYSSSGTEKYPELPDTLPILSNSGEIQVCDSFNSGNRDPKASALEEKVPTPVRSVNSTWIETIKTAIKFEAVASSECLERLNKNRESPLLPDSEYIDVESNTTTAQEDDRKFESESDATISDIIEPIETQNVAVGLENSSIAAKNARLQERPADSGYKIEKDLPEISCDSDETYYSDGDSIPRLRNPKAFTLKNSQRISQSTSLSHDGRVSVNKSDIIISPAASPVGNNNPEAPTTSTALLNTNNNNIRKKKKGKKGTLVAKLQAMVSSQVSNLRIWRYQMSRSNLKTSGSQFIVVKVRERETRYGRNYLTVSIVTDAHNLLKSIFESASGSASKKNASDTEVNTLTVVMVPEVVGVVKIKADSSLRIYPPWEIMDKSRKILNVIFFNVISVDKIDDVRKTVVVRENERIIEEFECPCIRAKALDDCCRVKFTNSKPSVMQAIFGS